MQSGRKNGRARTGKGNPYLKSALAQMATGAAKTDTFLGERYRRLIKRMPKAKAKVALQRSILVVIFHLLADPTTEFTDLGPDFYTTPARPRPPHQPPHAPTPGPGLPGPAQPDRSRLTPSQRGHPIAVTPARSRLSTSTPLSR